VRYLPTALESVRRQAGVDFEVVIVDDGSTDGSWEIAQAAADRSAVPVRVFRLPYNLGVTHALRFGLSRCDCRYVARQDADDVSRPGRLAIQAAFLDEHPRVAAVGSRVWILDASGAPVRHGARLRWLSRAQMLVGRNPVVHGTLMARRAAVEAVGGYRAIFEHAQDLDLLLRLGAGGRILVLGQALYGLRTHPGRISVSLRRRQRGYAALARWAYCAGGAA